LAKGLELNFNLGIKCLYPSLQIHHALFVFLRTQHKSFLQYIN